MKDKDIIDLRYNESYGNNILIIPEDIHEITITSHNKEINASIYAEARFSDLIINICNLNLNSIDNIAIDLREGDNNNYNNYIMFSGINTIKSISNIGVCISNNQKVDIIGNDEGELNVYGGVKCNAIGSNEYTAGSGHLKFRGSGKVTLIGGNGSYSKSSNVTCGQDGSYALGFHSNEDTCCSSIEINEGISLTIIGGNGEDICSMCEDNISGHGGAAINISYEGSFSKRGTGILNIIGGDAGKCCGNFNCGSCGNGGPGIYIKSGQIELCGNTIIKGGNGGSVDEKYTNCIASGGKGGDCIYVESRDSLSRDKSVVVNIYDDVELYGGIGGNSGIMLEYSSTDKIGAHGGKLLNGNDMVCKITVGSIKYREGSNGVNCKYDMIKENAFDDITILGNNVIYERFDHFNLPIDNELEKMIHDKSENTLNEENENYYEKKDNDDFIDVEFYDDRKNMNIIDNFNNKKSEIITDKDKLIIENNKATDNLPQIFDNKYGNKKGFLKSIIDFVKNIINKF